jgi:hypothetical protein
LTLVRERSVLRPSRWRTADSRAVRAPAFRHCRALWAKSQRSIAPVVAARTSKVRSNEAASVGGLVFWLWHRQRSRRWSGWGGAPGCADCDREDGPDRRGLKAFQRASRSRMGSSCPLCQVNDPLGHDLAHRVRLAGVILHAESNALANRSDHFWAERAGFHVSHYGHGLPPWLAAPPVQGNGKLRPTKAQKRRLCSSQRQKRRLRPAWFLMKFRRSGRLAAF